MAPACLAEPETIGAPAKADEALLSAALPGKARSVSYFVDGQAFIGKMCLHAQSLNDYSLRFEMTAYKKKKAETEIGRFYFKKPRLLRCEEIGEYRRGAVAVFAKDGKIYAHMGGPLSFYIATLSPSSSDLRCVNGYPMAQSDFNSIASYLKDMLAKGYLSRVSQEVESVGELSQSCWRLEMYDPKKNNQIVKCAWIDPGSFLPVKWFDYTNGRLFAVSYWKDLKVNAGLSDDIFNIWKNH